MKKNFTLSEKATKAMKKKDIDEIDLKILRILGSNASITNRDLAELVGLSPPPTLARVNALRSKGVIKKYQIEVNYNRLNYKVDRAITLTFRRADSKELLDSLDTIPWLAGCTIKLDKSSLVQNLTAEIRVVCPGEKDFQDVIKTFDKTNKILSASVQEILHFGTPDGVFHSTVDGPKLAEEVEKAIEKLEAGM